MRLSTSIEYSKGHDRNVLAKVTGAGGQAMITERGRKRVGKKPGRASLQSCGAPPPERRCNHRALALLRHEVAELGEELFAAGAYSNAGRAHEASLQVQDILRWVIILILLGGSALKLVGVI